MNALRRRTAACVAWLVLLLTMGAGCQPSEPETSAPGPTAPGEASSARPTSLPRPSSSASSASPRSIPSGSTRPEVQRVIAISVDGLNPRAISRLGPSGAPTFQRLLREGASTLNARTAVEATRTLPNHTGMLTGRRIDARSGGHGVTFNSDRRGSTVHRAAGHYVASVFDVAHDRGRTTAFYSAKTKFAVYPRSWNANGRPDRIGADHGRAKIDTVVIDTDNARLVARLVRQLRRNPATFTFLHISLPDAAGHRYGFMSRRYVTAVQRTDGLLGALLATVDAEPGTRGHTLVLLTADHGGSGPSHSDPTKLQNYRIPFLVWGPGVPAGRDLYAMNPANRNPGSRRPTYAGRQPIRNGDLANLVTDVLGLPVVPGSEFDRPRTLKVFSP